MPARDKRKLTKDEEGSAKASKPAPKASEAKKRKAGSPEAKPASVGKSKAKAASVAKSEAKPASVAKSKAGAADKVLFTHWLMKSEPDSRLENGVDVKFGVDDLEASPNQTAPWDGVRNYQARNFMRDMKVGQQSFFYHSNCKVPGIAGLMTVVKEAYPDFTQFDKGNPHYDPSSKADDPRWSMVDVKFSRKLKRFISLAEMKSLHLEHKKVGGPLASLSLFTRTRLSVHPLTEQEFEFILNLEN